MSFLTCVCLTLKKSNIIPYFPQAIFPVCYHTNHIEGVPYRLIWLSLWFKCITSYPVCYEHRELKIFAKAFSYFMIVITFLFKSSLFRLYSSIHFVYPKKSCFRVLRHSCHAHLDCLHLVHIFLGCSSLHSAKHSKCSFTPARWEWKDYFMLLTIHVPFYISQHIIWFETKFWGLLLLNLWLAVLYLPLVLIR